MIAIVKRPKSKSKSKSPAWHAVFLTMLPTIRRAAQIAFRGEPVEARGELVQAVIANAVVAIARLAELGKLELAYPSALARYAIAQVRSGRRVGSRLRIRDMMSEYAQRQKGFRVGQLDHFDQQEDQWQEIVVEDHRAGPAEIAACRIDFASWLRLLSRRQRKIALTLASGETTTAAAKKFRVTQGAISQFRQRLRRSWERFQGEANGGDVQLAASC